MLNYTDLRLQVKEVDDAGEFAGYASVFGNVDHGGDVIQAGAFKGSLRDHKRNKTMPALLWQHDHTQPVGVWKDMQEDSTGLVGIGQLAMKTQRGREAHELLKMEAVNGLSIGFVVKGDKVKDGQRILEKIDLWETSIVTFPMNPKARVSMVKSLVQNGAEPNPRDVENALRDALGFSRQQAKRFMAQGFAGLFLRDAVDGDTVAALKQLNDILRGT